jgi:hypothetical protein
VLSRRSRTKASELKIFLFYQKIELIKMNTNLKKMRVMLGVFNNGFIGGRSFQSDWQIGLAV